MKKRLEEALQTFLLLLPDYFPEKLGNPNDIHRWMDVCYQSCIEDAPLHEDDLVEALSLRFPQCDSNMVITAAKNYMRDYDCCMLLLDYLKCQHRLK